MQPDQVAHDGEAEPQSQVRPRARALGLAEAFEHVREEVGRDAAPRVGDQDSGVCAVTGQSRGDAATALGELDRVGEDVPHHLLEPHAVAHHARAGRIDDDLERDAAAGGRRPDGLGGGADHGVQLHRLTLHGELAGCDPGEIDQVVDQSGEETDVALDGLDPPFRGDGVDPALTQDRGPTERRVERRAQLVREHREELVLGAVRFLGDGLRRLRALEQPQPLLGDGPPLRHDRGQRQRRDGHRAHEDLHQQE